MNKLLLVATLFLIIGGVCSDVDVKKFNEGRAAYGKKKGITMKPVTISEKLNEYARKVCDECPQKNEIKPEAGYQTHVFSSEIELQKNVEVFMNPDTTEIGGCEAEKCESKGYVRVYIINSGIHFGSSLTFLMAFVMICRGI